MSQENIISKTDFRVGCKVVLQKTKDAQDTASCLRNFLPPFQKPGRIFTDNSQEFTKVCQDLQWTPDTNTPQRSETNGVAERAVRRVEGGTGTAMFQSGLPVNLWDCARNVATTSATRPTRWPMERQHV